MNPLRPEQNGHQFGDNIFKNIFLTKNVWLSSKFHWYLYLRFQFQLVCFSASTLQVPSHYLNWYWLDQSHHQASLSHNKLTSFTFYHFSIPKWTQPSHPFIFLITKWKAMLMDAVSFRLSCPYLCYHNSRSIVFGLTNTPCTLFIVLQLWVMKQPAYRSLYFAGMVMKSGCRG